MLIKVTLTTGMLASSAFAFTLAQAASSGAFDSSLQAQATDEKPLPAEREVKASPPAETSEAEDPEIRQEEPDATEKVELDGTKMTSAEIVLAAQAAGYKVVTERGTQLFCRQDDVLGSRLRKRTRCLTAAEMEQEHAAASDSLAEMSRKTMNPPGD
jgi:hypothetical protein